MYLENIPVFNFSTPSIEDLGIMGISHALYSPYNVKAEYQGKIVGYITIQERDINLPIRNNLIKEELDYATMLKSQKWFLLRKISFESSYIKTGNLLNMFDYLIRILPKDCYLWTNKYWDRKTCFIDCLGGFTPLPTDICKNENILIFNVHQRKNE